MATPYVLKVDHQGTTGGDFGIFHTYEDRDGEKPSVVWVSKAANPGTKVTFEWNNPLDSLYPPKDELGFGASNPILWGRQCWIAFGDFEEGEELDPDCIAQKHEIIFSEDQRVKTLRFAEDNTWEEIE